MYNVGVGRTRLGITARVVVAARAAIALAFAFTILLEPVLDDRCNAQPHSASQGFSRADVVSTGGADACASTCVSDCYCCSTPIVATVSLDPPSTPFVAIDRTRPFRPIDGVAAVPDPPPIA